MNERTLNFLIKARLNESNKTVKTENKNDSEVKYDEYETLKRDNFLAYAKMNTLEFNGKVIGKIIDKCVKDSETMAYPGVPCNGFFTDTYQMYIPIDGIVMPYVENSENASKVAEDYHNQIILDFCKEYTQKNGNYIVMLYYGRTYYLPAIFNKELFESLGFIIYYDGESLGIAGDKEACLNLLYALNNEFILSKEQKSYINEDKLNAGKELLQKYNVISNYVTESLNNADEVLYLVCEKVIDSYKNGNITDNNTIETSIKVEDCENLNFNFTKKWIASEFNKACDSISSPMIFIPKHDSDEPKFAGNLYMVFEEHLRRALREIGSTFIIINDEIKIVTNVDKFREVLRNIDNNSRRK